MILPPYLSTSFNRKIHGLSLNSTRAKHATSRVHYTAGYLEDRKCILALVKAGPCNWPKKQKAEILA